MSMTMRDTKCKIRFLDVNRVDGKFIKRSHLLNQSSGSDLWHCKLCSQRTSCLFSQSEFLHSKSANFPNYQSNKQCPKNGQETSLSVRLRKMCFILRTGLMPNNHMMSSKQLRQIKQLIAYAIKLIVTCPAEALPTFSVLSSLVYRKYRDN